MANYKETHAVGTSYTRANTVILTNEPTFKHIEFQEERVMTMADGELIRERKGMVDAEFTAENAATSFAILDPYTLEDTGAVASYGTVYSLMTSLYLHLATERDNYVPPVVEAPQQSYPFTPEEELVFLEERKAELLEQIANS